MPNSASISFVKEALTRLVRLNPFAVEHELRNRALAGVRDKLLGRARRLLNVDLGEGNRVLGEEALGFAAVTAPVG